MENKIDLISIAERDRETFAAYVDQGSWKKLSPPAQRALLRLAANYNELMQALKNTRKVLDGCYGLMMQPYYDEAQQWRILSVSPMEYSQARVRLAASYGDLMQMYFRERVDCMNCQNELDEDSVDVYRMRGKRLCLDCLFEREDADIV